MRHNDILIAIDQLVERSRDLKASLQEAARCDMEANNPLRTDALTWAHYHMDRFSSDIDDLIRAL